MITEEYREEAQPQAKKKPLSTNEKSHKDGLKQSHKSSFVKSECQDGKKNFACDTCGRAFAKKMNLVEHFKVHTGEKNFLCSVCGKAFAYSKTLKLHKRVHTGEKNFSCEICHKKFAYNWNLTRHLRNHEAEEKCPITLLTIKNILQTRKRKLQTIKIKREANEVFVCNQTFSMKSKLTDHARVHVEKKFICEYCGKKFRSKTHLSVHITIHTGERKFSCEVCGKQFSQKSHLRVHARIHTGEKNYACGECGSRFNIKSHLNYHIRLHTGERNYPCEICGKKYIQNSALTKHNKRFHTQAQGGKQRKCSKEEGP